MYPQKKEAGIARNRAAADIMPISTNDPPRAIIYNGRNIDSRPNAISWKKNPSRHIATKRFQGAIKTFTSLDFNLSLGLKWFFINP
jgi:hypothetical protein